MRSRKLNITPRVIVTHVESWIFFLSIIVEIYKKICKRTIVHKFDTLRKASVVEDVVTHKDLQEGDMIVHPGI